MRFRILRTSDSSESQKPCENAIFIGETIFGKKWEIEINTIEDLKKLQIDCGITNELIISFSADDMNEICDEPYIEIYDDWRE